MPEQAAHKGNTGVYEDVTYQPGENFLLQWRVQSVSVRVGSEDVVKRLFILAVGAGPKKGSVPFYPSSPSTIRTTTTETLSRANLLSVVSMSASQDDWQSPSDRHSLMVFSSTSW